MLQLVVKTVVVSEHCLLVFDTHQLLRQCYYNIVEKMQVKQQNIDLWLKKMAKCKIILRKGKGIGTTFHVSEYFTIMIEDYDKASRQYSKVILELLYNDGLMPKNARFKGSRLGIDIKLPMGKKRIHLECSPLAVARQSITASKVARQSITASKSVRGLKT